MTADDLIAALAAATPAQLREVRRLLVRDEGRTVDPGRPDALHPWEWEHRIPGPATPSAGPKPAE
jgi:hypothetical protein